MPDRDALTACVTRLGDNALILSHRLTELVTHGPELEEELATANFALDYLGQARAFYSYAGELEGRGRDEDDFAFHRDAAEFQNFLFVELPNGHFGDTVVRQVLFDSYYSLYLDGLAACRDDHLSDIATRVAKEVDYHLRHSARWFVRLGDGTDESHTRMQKALDDVWRYTGEFFVGDAVDDAVHEAYGVPAPASLKDAWRANLERLAADATLSLPEDGWMAGGGRQGLHTEHLGFLVAEMQHLPRSQPVASW